MMLRNSSYKGILSDDVVRLCSGGCWSNCDLAGLSVVTLEGVLECPFCDRVNLEGPESWSTAAVLTMFWISSYNETLLEAPTLSSLDVSDVELLDRLVPTSSKSWPSSVESTTSWDGSRRETFLDSAKSFLGCWPSTGGSGSVSTTRLRVSVKSSTSILSTLPAKSNATSSFRFNFPPRLPAWP